MILILPLIVLVYLLGGLGYYRLVESLRTSEAAPRALLVAISAFWPAMVLYTLVREALI